MITRATVTGLVGWALIAAWGLPVFGEEESDHAGLTTVVVGILPTRLLPTVALLEPDQTIAWLNYSSRSLTISMDAQVANQMRCTTPGPFQLSGDRLEAKPLPSVGFASLCQLAPGEYDYEVQVSAAPGREGDPTMLVGKIVVR